MTHQYTSIDSLLEVIRNNKISAKNKSKWSELSLCVNIIEIPETELSVLTVSVLYDGKRRNAMPTMDFAHMMNTIEDIIGYVHDERDYGDMNDYVCTTLAKVLDDYWYRVINAHRVFFIPTSRSFEFINRMRNCVFNVSVSGVVIYLKLESCTGTIKIV